jgi:cytochrome b involved in lipid metabolism
MSRTFTYHEVSKHASRSDLYLVIHQMVYNATQFVNEHPGGEEVLLDVAGQDATEAFEDVGHSDEACDILQGMYVGRLISVPSVKVSNAAAEGKAALPEPKCTIPNALRTFTPHTLLQNNGENGFPIYIAVNGKVYDVTPGKNYYGPGGPYHSFAGRDATRGFACQSFDTELLTKDLDGPLDDCSDLTLDQIENLNGWKERLEEKVDMDLYYLWWI